MLLIFATMVGIATQYPADARFMPLVVGIPGIALCVLQLGLDAVRAHDGQSWIYRFRSAPKAGKPAVPAEEELPEFGSHTRKRELVMWGYVIAFIAAILAFGFYIAVPVMLVAFLRREAGRTWGVALLLGAGAMLVLYLMFSALLRIVLYPGLLTPMILRGLGM
jgi:hypothetical protein